VQPNAVENPALSEVEGDPLFLEATGAPQEKFSPVTACTAVGANPEFQTIKKWQRGTTSQRALNHRFTR